MKVKPENLKESTPKKKTNKKKTGPKAKSSNKAKTKKGKLGIKKKSLKKSSKRLSIIKNEVTDINENTIAHESNTGGPNEEVLLISKSEVSYKHTSEDNENMDMQQNPMNTQSDIIENIPAADDNLDLLNNILTSTVRNDDRNQGCYDEDILADTNNQNQVNDTLTNTVEDDGNMNYSKNVPVDDQENNNVTNRFKCNLYIDENQNNKDEKMTIDENVPVNFQEKCESANTVQDNDETNINENIPASDQKNNELKSICYPNNIPVDDQKNNKLKSICCINNTTDESNNCANNFNISPNPARRSVCENTSTIIEAQNPTKQLENKCLVYNKYGKSSNKIFTNQNTQTENVISSTSNGASKNYPNNNINNNECNTEAPQFKHRTLDDMSFWNRWSPFKHFSKSCNKHGKAEKNRGNACDRHLDETKNKIYTGRADGHKNSGIIYKNNDLNVQKKTILPLYEYRDSAVFYTDYQNDVKLSNFCENNNPVITGPPIQKETKLLVTDLDNWIHNFDRRCICQNKLKKLCYTEDE